MRRDIGILRAYGFVLFMGVGTFFPFVYLYLQKLGFSNIQLGVLGALGPAVMMIVQPFWGWLSDLTGRPGRLSMFLSLGVGASVMLLLTARTFPLVVLYMILFNVFYSSITPIYDSVVIDSIQGTKVGYGQVRWWGSLGYALTVLAVGYLIEHTTLAVALRNYIYLSLLLAFLALVLPRPKSHQKSAKETKVQTREKLQLWPLFKNRELMIFLLAGGFVIGSYAINYTFLSFLLKDLGGSEGLIGLANMIAAFAEIPFFFFSAKLLERYKVQNMLLLAFGVTALRWFLNSIATSPYQILVFQLLHSLTFGLMYSSAVVYVAKLVPERLRATGQNLFWATTYGFGNVVGNLLGGWVYQHNTAESIFAMAGGAALIGTLIMFGGIVLPMQCKAAAAK